MKAQLKGLEKRKQNLMSRLLATQKYGELTPIICILGNWGIDHILVDEAHRFKNLQYTTRHDQVGGLGPPKVQKEPSTFIPTLPAFVADTTTMRTRD